MMDGWKERFDEVYSLIRKSLFVMAIMLYGVGLIHESGHALICISDGGTFDWFLFFLHHVDCEGATIKSYFLYWSLGGIFGLISSSVFLVLPKIRNDKGVFVGVLTVIVSQTVNLMFETLAHTAYLQNNIALILNIMAVLIAYLALLRFFIGRITKTKT